MPFPHAVIWIDARTARVLYFADQKFPIRRFARTVTLRARDPASAEAADALLLDLCDALADVPQLLLTGTSEGISAFERHVGSRAPAIAGRIVGVQQVSAPTNARLSALARWHFMRVPPVADDAGDA